MSKDSVAMSDEEFLLPKLALSIVKLKEIKKAFLDKYDFKNNGKSKFVTRNQSIPLIKPTEKVQKPNNPYGVNEQHNIGKKKDLDEYNYNRESFPGKVVKANLMFASRVYDMGEKFIEEISKNFWKAAIGTSLTIATHAVAEELELRHYVRYPITILSRMFRGFVFNPLTQALRRLGVRAENNELVIVNGEKDDYEKEYDKWYDEFRNQIEAERQLAIENDDIDNYNKLQEEAYNFNVDYEAPSILKLLENKEEAIEAPKRKIGYVIPEKKEIKDHNVNDLLEKIKNKLRELGYMEKEESFKNPIEKNKEKLDSISKDLSALTKHRFIDRIVDRSSFIGDDYNKFKKEIKIQNPKHENINKGLQSHFEKKTFNQLLKEYINNKNENIVENSINEVYEKTQEPFFRSYMENLNSIGNSIYDSLKEVHNYFQQHDTNRDSKFNEYSSRETYSKENIERTKNAEQQLLNFFTQMQLPNLLSGSRSSRDSYDEYNREKTKQSEWKITDTMQNIIDGVPNLDIPKIIAIIKSNGPTFTQIGGNYESDYLKYMIMKNKLGHSNLIYSNNNEFMNWLNNAPSMLQKIIHPSLTIERNTDHPIVSYFENVGTSLEAQEQIKRRKLYEDQIAIQNQNRIENGEKPIEADLNPVDTTNILNKVDQFEKAPEEIQDNNRNQISTLLNLFNKPNIIPQPFPEKVEELQNDLNSAPKIEPEPIQLEKKDLQEIEDKQKKLLYELFHQQSQAMTMINPNQIFENTTNENEMEINEPEKYDFSNLSIYSDPENHVRKPLIVQSIKQITHVKSELVRMADELDQKQYQFYKSLQNGQIIINSKEYNETMKDLEKRVLDLANGIPIPTLVTSIYEKIKWVLNLRRLDIDLYGKISDDLNNDKEKINKNIDTNIRFLIESYNNGFDDSTIGTLSSWMDYIKPEKDEHLTTLEFIGDLQKDFLKNSVVSLTEEETNNVIDKFATKYNHDANILRQVTDDIRLKPFLLIKNLKTQEEIYKEYQLEKLEELKKDNYALLKDNPFMEYGARNLWHTMVQDLDEETKFKLFSKQSTIQDETLLVTMGDFYINYLLGNSGTYEQMAKGIKRENEIPNKFLYEQELLQDSRKILNAFINRQVKNKVIEEVAQKENYELFKSEWIKHYERNFLYNDFLTFHEKHLESRSPPKYSFTHNLTGRGIRKIDKNLSTLYLLKDLNNGSKKKDENLEELECKKCGNGENLKIVDSDEDDLICNDCIKKNKKSIKNKNPKLVKIKAVEDSENLKPKLINKKINDIKKKFLKKEDEENFLKNKFHEDTKDLDKGFMERFGKGIVDNYKIKKERDINRLSYLAGLNEHHPKLLNDNHKVNFIQLKNHYIKANPNPKNFLNLNNFKTFDGIKKEISENPKALLDIKV